MKKLFCAVLITIWVLNLKTAVYAYDGTCSAKAAVLFQPDTNTVLFEKNSEEPFLIASTTKIMTALVVLENADTNDIVEITSAYTSVEGSSMHLKAGERFTVEELLYGLLLASGNDAAVALAHHVSVSIENFAELMNRKAVDLGCVNTHFENPHGLDSEKHYSCAIDLAIIMKAAMENEKFAEITATKSIELAGRVMENHNKLLWNCDGCIGGKTGYTQKAGRTLVSFCKRDDSAYICVTISDSDDWNDHTKLYNWAFDEFTLVKLNDEFQIPVISGKSDDVSVSCQNGAILLKNDGEINIDCKLPEFVYAPVEYGEQIGTVTISTNNKFFEFVITANEVVPLDEAVPLNFWEQLKWSWYYYNGHSGYIPFLPRY